MVTKQNIIFLLLSVLFLGGCAGTTVAPKLLTQPHNKNPIVNKSVVVSYTINQNIDRYEKVEESIKESLDIALNNSNIFRKNGKKHYKLITRTVSFSQSPMSFGMFGNRLKVNYQLYNEGMKLILNKSIFTIAESDEWFFSGLKRAQRARAVNIAKNVNQFMIILQKKLKR